MKSFRGCEPLLVRAGNGTPFSGEPGVRCLGRGSPYLPALRPGDGPPAEYGRRARSVSQVSLGAGVPGETCCSWGGLQLPHFLLAMALCQAGARVPGAPPGHPGQKGRLAAPSSSHPTGAAGSGSCAFLLGDGMLGAGGVFPSSRPGAGLHDSAARCRCRGAMRRPRDEGIRCDSC